MVEISNKIIRYASMGGIGVLGVVAGYAYYKYVGCASGTCAITSNPIISSIYGGIMGILLANTFIK